MLDNNLRTDGEKIAYVIGQPHGTEVITTILNEQAGPLAITEMVEQFGVHDMLTGQQNTTAFVFPIGKRQPNLVISPFSVTPPAPKKTLVQYIPQPPLD